MSRRTRNSIVGGGKRHTSSGGDLSFLGRPFLAFGPIRPFPGPHALLFAPAYPFTRAHASFRLGRLSSCLCPPFVCARLPFVSAPRVAFSPSTSDAMRGFGGRGESSDPRTVSAAIVYGASAGVGKAPQSFACLSSAGRFVEARRKLPPGSIGLLRRRRCVKDRTRRTHAVLGRNAREIPSLFRNNGCRSRRGDKAAAAHRRLRKETR